jgi:hypothetical protein
VASRDNAATDTNFDWLMSVNVGSAQVVAQFDTGDWSSSRKICATGVFRVPHDVGWNSWFSVLPASARRCWVWRVGTSAPRAGVVHEKKGGSDEVEVCACAGVLRQRVPRTTT